MRSVLKFSRTSSRIAGNRHGTDKRTWAPKSCNYSQVAECSCQCRLECTGCKACTWSARSTGSVCKVIRSSPIGRNENLVSSWTSERPVERELDSHSGIDIGTWSPPRYSRLNRDHMDSDCTGCLGTWSFEGTELKRQ